jgi:hypothetical protein
MKEEVKLPPDEDSNKWLAINSEFLTLNESFDFCVQLTFSMKLL